MHTLIRRSVAGFALLAVATSTHALLIAHDSAWGARSLIYDTDTGFDWVRLDVTYQISVNAVVDHTSAGGLFDGFRFATRSELSNLFPRDLGFIPNGMSFPSQPPSVEVAAAIVERLDMFGGRSLIAATAERSVSCPIDECYEAGHRQAFSAHWMDNGWGYTIDDSSVAVSVNPHPSQGSWLLAAGRPPPVTSPAPEPGTLALLGAGLIAAAMRARVGKRPADRDH